MNYEWSMMSVVLCPSSLPPSHHLLHDLPYIALAAGWGAVPCLCAREALHRACFLNVHLRIRSLSLILYHVWMMGDLYHIQLRGL